MKIVFQILILIAVFALGWFLKPTSQQKFESQTSNSGVKEVRGENNFSFINPLLECEQAESAFVELKPFRGRIQGIVDEILTQNKAKFVSVYFRDLNNGPWFGINEKENFSPASLLKIPVMMAYYIWAQEEPAILEKKLELPKDAILPEDVPLIKASQRIGKGQPYQVSELIERMIIYSDNYAAYLLVTHMAPERLKKIYTDFNLAIPTPNSFDVQVRIKDYAAFLRVLYNGSYLSHEYSDQSLKLLSLPEYDKALKAGVPENIIVSHKFGERAGVGNDLLQLHDCGIVYYPKHPYLLCVMTRGNDLNQLNSAIADLSSLVYKEVDKQILTIK